MTVETVAIMAPGHMGHAIGGHLVRAGLSVITNLEGRSADTRARATEAGMTDVGDDEVLVERADMVLSILPPGRAVEFARRIARAVHGTSARPLFVDCNAISPATARELAGICEGAGLEFVDAGIRGGAPTGDRPQPRIYASGSAADRFAELNDFGLDIRPVGPEPGQASGLKMCGAAVSKGVVLVVIEAFIAARVLGIADELAEDLGDNRLVAGARRRSPNLGPDAYRWAEEMDEIATAFNDAGVPGKVFEGMADFCRFVEGTALAEDRKGHITLGTGFDAIIALLAEAARKDLPR